MKSISILFQQVFQFFRESRQEAKKVNWPTKRETMVNTALVIIFTVFVAALLGAFDAVLVRIVERIVL
ncbi:MAG: preprotein translocase subunit SecE [Candidatus Yanofskybacteria bacterium]|nr:preprotein translocase subunit SecE [Candidatus Yanofskybacteria bacterium]